MTGFSPVLVRPPRDGEDLATDPTGGGRTQKQGGIGHVLRLAQAFDGRVAEHTGLNFGGEHRLQRIGAGGTWATALTRI